MQLLHSQPGLCHARAPQAIQTAYIFGPTLTQVVVCGRYTWLGNYIAIGILSAHQAQAATSPAAVNVAHSAAPPT